MASKQPQILIVPNYNMREDKNRKDQNIEIIKSMNEISNEYQSALNEI